jgi:catechol 2,3-dioxygenase-like lactoylglutathione lyase family enzyme
MILISNADVLTAAANPRSQQLRMPTKNPAVEAQPLIAVRDVRAAAKWYTTLLGADSLPDHEHRDVYDRIYCSGRMVLQLHAWDEEEHPNLVNSAAAPPGHGVLLWFVVADFDAAVKRARALKAEVIEEPHVNPAPQSHEMWLRDPDGYVVVIASPDGEAAEA